MTVVGLVSPKHAPGVTTTAVALALAAGEGALVVEADPAGGDIAARAGVPLEPGLLTMAAAGRHGNSVLTMRPQRLQSGVDAVIAPTNPDQASAALGAIADRLGAAVSGADVACIDCGRWSPLTAVPVVLAACDVVVVVTDPTVAGIEHVRCRLDAISAIGPPVTVLLVGDRPYGAGEVEHAVGVPVAGTLAVDPRGAVAVYGGPPRLARKSQLCRSAHGVLERLVELATQTEVRT
jgi:MinD-like ATPase involved in chromosome partitioning or flagellar assembly